MLISAHSIVHYDRGVATPDRLTRVAHRHYLGYAARMLDVYRCGLGRSRRELHAAVRAVLAREPDCDPRRVGAFCKLLDDAGEFDRDRRGRAAALRLEVFARAAAMYPLVSRADAIFERTEFDAKQAISAELGRTWREIDAELYADVIDRQTLRTFAGFPSAEAVLSRYNLGQLQACLYRAHEATVLASADFAAIVRHAKLARLLVETTRRADGRYRIDLSGPASMLHETRRYGVSFARFVAALVACRGWELRATVATRWGGTARLNVSSDDGYRSHVAAPAGFDSEVERMLAQDWGESCDGWTLHREAGILQRGQTTFVPDFRLRHQDGRTAFLEIVGFWTPQYLEAKRRTLRTFARERIVLAIPKKTAKVNAAGPGVVVYAKRIDPREVIRAVEATIPTVSHACGPLPDPPPEYRGRE